MATSTKRKTTTSKRPTGGNAGGNQGNFSPQQMKSWNGLLAKLQQHPFMKQGGLAQRTTARTTGSGQKQQRTATG